MALVNVTPIMTSNTTPSPYVISASSINGTGNFEPFRAFDNVTNSQVASGSLWATAQGVIASWIKIDFGSVTKTNIIHITSPNISSLSGHMPKKFTLHGSNDDSRYDEIITIENQVSWGVMENREFSYNACEYRYYRLNIIEHNGGSSTGIGEIKFYYDDEKNSISHKNANLVYTLPMATTSQIKAKSGDSRAGLLGMANDPENFGDLYVVGRDGKAHLTKSGIKSEVIFDGNASTTSTTYNLKSSYKNFKYLLFNGCTIVSGSDYARSSMMIPVEAITTSKNGSSYVFGAFHSGENRGYTIGIRFENETSFVLSSSQSSISTWSAPKIYRVDGIY